MPSPEGELTVAGPDPLAVRAALTRPGALPRTAIGKLVKRELREWIDSGMSRF